MKIILTILIITFTLSLSSVTWVVRQDGFGQFATIQSAITASSHSDTVLVYPGVYYENIHYSGKNITIASRELITGNQAYRDSTIIDGNRNGSCVRVMFNENNASIYGFTLQHGSGTPFSFGSPEKYGGGIRIVDANNFRISNCLIKDNRTVNGGGIAILRGSAYIRKVIITNNYASGGGGGIYINGISNLYFNSTDRCSVYENYSGNGNDILCVDTGSIINVYLEMLTVNPATGYYLRYTKSTPTWFGNFGIIDIQQGYRTEVNHDLYITPEGNDDNDGFSWLTPKKTIAKALHTIASDSLNPKTIYLAPGTYSSEEGQIFPLSMKPFVYVIGNSVSLPTIINQRYEYSIKAPYANGAILSNLILEHENYSPIYVFSVFRSDSIRVSNLVINPVSALYSAGIGVFHSNCDLNNICLNGLYSTDSSGLTFSQSYGSIKNVTINDCHNTGGANSVSCVVSIDYDSLLVIENMAITNCSVNTPEAGIFSISTYYSNNPSLRMSNVLVANNTTNGMVPVVIDHLNANTANISNCTFVNNSGGSKTATFYGKMNISNCIFYNNTQNEIAFGFVNNHTNQMQVSNNLIKNFPSSVYVNPALPITFNDYNFTASPSFAGNDITNPLSYRLNFDSPCIDAGTPDTTGLYLPAFDFYGNPRIYNGTIDIGCHEWDSTINPQSVVQPITDVSLAIYPNPFFSQTNISYSIPSKGNAELEIFNIKGQKVFAISLKEKVAGQHSIIWNGKDSYGNPCSSGVYFCKLQFNNRNVSKKLILMK